MKKLSLLFLILSFSIHAQTWNWAKSAGGDSWNVAYDIVTDDAGNSYVTGGFYDTAYFNTNLLTGTGWTIYLAKYTSNGNCAWARKAGGNGEDYGTGVCFDNLGGLYLSGVFTDSLFFPTDTLVTSSNIFDAFIARYDTAGNFIWVKQCGEPVNDQWANAVGSDQWGNAYLTGMFGGNASFGTLSMNSIGPQDMFLAKFSPAGNTIWARKAGYAFGSGADTYGDIATDKKGNSFITGGFGGTVAWGSFTLTSSGTDAYVTRYDSAGNCLWVKKAGGSGNDGGNGIAIDKQKNSFITGEFRNTATFGTNTVTSNGAADIFIAKYDSLGNELWVRSAGDINGDYGYGVTTDSLGNCYATGEFMTTAQFGTVTVNGFGGNDIYVAKYFANGNLDWVKDAGGLGSDRGYKLCNDLYGNLYVTGDYTSTPAAFDTISLAGLSGAAVVFVGKIVTATITDVQNYSASDIFSVFPNPTNGIINISGKINELKNISITNILGEKISPAKGIDLVNKENLLTIDLNSYANGIYFVQINSGNTQIVKKIVVSR